MMTDKIEVPRELLEALDEILDRADTSEGYCCCGDSMQNHPNPMDCGHSPVDAGDYYAGPRRDELKALLREAAQPDPIDMVLHCPKCGMQHIDEPETHHLDAALAQAGMDESYSASWENPPHRSHLCHGCGHIWRPADVPTNGVAAVKTRGKADSPVSRSRPAGEELRMSCPMQDQSNCALFSGPNNATVRPHPLAELFAGMQEPDADMRRATAAAIQQMYNEAPTVAGPADEALLTRCLQALEESFDTVRNEFENDWRHGVPTRKAQLDLMREAAIFHEDTIKQLKSRLGK